MELHNLNTDAAVPSLNCDNAYRQPIVIPDVEETAKWDALASDFCARMDSAGEQEITLIAPRGTPLPCAASGRLRVSDAEKSV
jgi:hypothetical protein